MIHRYNNAGLMFFTAHVHPKAPQDDKVSLYGVQSGGKGRKGGTELIKGGRVVVCYGRSSKKIDKSRLVSSLFISFCVFFSTYTWQY